MADLSKTIRATCDFKVELYQEGKRKFANIFDFNSKSSDIGLLVMKGEKMDRSMSDDEVIQETLKIFATSNYDQNIRDNSSKSQDFYKIIQDPWSDTPPIKRKYGFDPYYLNNGCKFFIKWIKNDSQQGSDSDNADSTITKDISLYMPSGFTENEGKGFIRVDKETRKYGYSTKIGYNWQEWEGIVKDEEIIKTHISLYKSAVIDLYGDNSYNLELCDPDTKFCSIIDYKSPITPPVEVPSTGSTSSTPSQKIQFSLVGLPDVVQIKAKQDLPDFTVYIGDPPKNVPSPEGGVSDDDTDAFMDSEGDEELGQEYGETDFSGEEESEIKFLLNNNVGDYEVTETTTSADGTSLSTNNAGGAGEHQFQKSMTIDSQKILNGEIPDKFLLKLDFCSLKLEIHAAKQLNALNKKFKAKFGENITMSGGYRTFAVQNAIFDWTLWNSEKKARKKGTNGGTAAAKPGTSQHGWGLAIDTSGMGDEGSAKFDWLEENGSKYGWVNPSWAKKSGAGHEPWHREYNGNDKFRNDIA